MSEFENPTAFVSKTDYDKVVSDLTAMTTQRDMWMNSNHTNKTNLESLREEVKQFIVDNMDNYVSKDSLMELAETCGIELTKEFAFELTVRFSGYGTIEGMFDEDKLRELLEGAFSSAETSFDNSGFEEISVEQEGFSIDSIDFY